AAVGVHADRLDAAADGLVGAGRPARSRGPGARTPPPPRFAARPESAVRAENDATGEREGDDVTEAAADIADLAGTARRDLPEVLADLRRLVEHETPSSDKELLDAGLDDIEEWLAERLGPPASRVRHGGGAHGDVLELGYPGTGAGTVLLLCHYDTVWPRGTIRGGPVTVDGDRFSGPGCFDMKAGIVQGVWALRALRELGLPAPAVRILLNGDEEIGSPASRAHIERAGAEADLTLVLEPSRAGKVKTGRKGMGLFDVTATGIESHAGLDPEAGASAVHALAALVPQITALAAPERGTTVNVGVFAGGTARNVVA